MCSNHPHAPSLRVREAEDIRERANDGGCSRKCDARLACGHSCPRMCHPDDRGHSAARCMQPCPRVRSAEASRVFKHLGAFG